MTHPLRVRKSPAQERTKAGAAARRPDAPAAKGEPSTAWTALALGAAPAAADAQEQEAERTAHRVLSDRAPLCATCGGGSSHGGGSGGAPHVRAQADAGGLRASGLPGAAAAASRGAAGTALPTGLRSFFEPRMGGALGDVRVHTDAEAARSAQALNARAYTVGSDVHFGAGQFQPTTPPGWHLIAHELAHVVQQRRSGAACVQRFSWNDVLDAIDPDPNRVCGRELGEAEDWARAGPYPAAPATQLSALGTGGFDAQYIADPAQGNGVLRLTQGVAVTFKDTLMVTGGVVAPHADLPATAAIAALATRMNGIADPAARAAAVASYQWTAAEKTPWINQLEPLIEQGWGGQHEFFLNQPRWEWLGATVAVDLNVGERARGAADHLDLETYKTPTGESLRTFAISHRVNSGSATDGMDQTMRLASTGVDVLGRDLLTSSVEFPLGSAVLTGAAQATLNRFITRFNGANAHVAHQEIRVDLIGHASASGEEAANQLLSEQRTAAVREYLRANGFANVATRVVEDSRGEREADASDPRRARDQRVDLLVDGGARQITALHEFGHTFGVNDEYGVVGTTPGHDTRARNMTDASGANLPGAVREHNGGVMSLGNEVRARHYANFHHALQTITAKSPWSLGPHKAKWQVQMECGLPSPPGDWNVPGPDDGTRTA